MSALFKPFSRAEFERMWNEGVRVVDIAASIQCSPGTVSQRARRFGLVPRILGGHYRIPRPLKDYSGIRDQFAEMVAAGATARELASKFRISTRIVSRLKRLVGSV